MQTQVDSVQSIFQNKILLLVIKLCLINTHSLVFNASLLHPGTFILEVQIIREKQNDKK